MRFQAKFVVRVLLSLAVSGVFVVFSLRHTDLNAVAAAIGRADPLPVLGYLAILVLIHFIKTVRWGLLLRPLGDIGFRRLNAASAVGFMLMVVLPLRLGELVRPLLVARTSVPGEQKLSRSGALGSCLVERVIDSLAVGVLGIISLRLLAPSGESADLARHGATLVTACFAALCVALIFGFFARERFVALVRRLLTPASPKLAARVAKLLDGLLYGLNLGSPALVLGFLALTGVYWALHVWGFWMVAHAFDLNITGWMACTVVACQVVGIMIPAGPGMVGTSQFFTQLGVSVFIPAAFTATDVAARAAAYGNTIWALQFGQQFLTGVPFVLLGRVSLAGVLDRWEGDPVAQAAEAGQPEVR
jgi:uncharacterized protein (TIRG00374 family)